MDKKFRKVSISKLGIDIVTHDPVIILTDEDRECVIPLVVGIFEATSIAFALERNELPRPLAHDLIRSILDKLGASLLRIEIYDIRQDTYYCNLVVERSDGEIIEIDARPSDAIAVALRTDSDIYIAEELIERISVRQRIAERSPFSEDGSSGGENGQEEQQDRGKEVEVDDFLASLDSSMNFDDEENGGTDSDEDTGGA